MPRLQILGAVAFAVLMMAPDAMARGAARSGMRGAMVGGMVGGSSGAQKGAKAGVVVGATRGVAERTADRHNMDSESQSRSQYESSTEYQEAQHSNFSEAPPEVLASSAVASSETPGGEAIIRKNGKPIVGITYPSDWKQKEGDNFVSAVSAKGNAWSIVATIDGASDNQAGLKKVKEGLDKYLTDIEYDDLTKTERGAVVITGSGKGKKTGIPVVFAAGVFDAAPGQLAGAAFVVDENAEDHYKEAVRYMCQSIRVAKDFEQQ